jgi:cell division protein FtsL
MSALRAATRTVKQTQRTGSLRNVNPRTVKIALIALSGLIVIQLLHVLMGGFTAQFTYEISHLKAEKSTLSTQADILSSEVNSLSSNQNLVDVAHSLGMVSNVNPVFLRLSDGTVIGKPHRAQANERTVSKNLVPNAAMTTGTDTANLTLKNTDTVLASSKSSAAVASGINSSIQASPTN